MSSPAFADGQDGGDAPPAVQQEAAPAPALAPSADENEFIAKLKAQSDAKRDVYKKQAQSSDKLSLRQFSSQYERPSYVSVYSKGGTSYEMLLKQDVEMLERKGKVEKRMLDEDDASKGYRYFYK